jgi:hypothetical protein
VVFHFSFRVSCFKSGIFFRFFSPDNGNLEFQNVCERILIKDVPNYIGSSFYLGYYKCSLFPNGKLI